MALVRKLRLLSCWRSLPGLPSFGQPKTATAAPRLAPLDPTQADSSPTFRRASGSLDRAAGG
jgi:hypothetical protein